MIVIAALFLLMFCPIAYLILVSPTSHKNKRRHKQKLRDNPIASHTK